MSRFTSPTSTREYAPSHSPPDVRYAPGIRVARGLGWFSIALGLAELFAPKEMARLTGVPDTQLFKFYGLREIACGVGILTSAQPSRWLWARAAGDALDLVALATRGENSAATATAAAAVASVAVLDVLSATELTMLAD